MCVEFKTRAHCDNKDDDLFMIVVVASTVDAENRHSSKCELLKSVLVIRYNHPTITTRSPMCLLAVGKQARVRLFVR